MAAGKFNMQKASGGVASITIADGVGATNIVLPESGTVATEQYVDAKTVASSETVSGVIELATTAEARSGTDAVRAITPLQLFNSLKGSNQSLASSGYQKLHGGLIIQWGSYTTGTTTVTLPIAYPTAHVYAGGSGSTAVAFVVVNFRTLSSFGINSNAPVGTWISIGY